MSGIQPTLSVCASREIIQLKQPCICAIIAQSVGMAISVRLATTGDLLYTKAYNSVDELRVWELRLH